MPGVAEPRRPAGSAALGSVGELERRHDTWNTLEDGAARNADLTEERIEAGCGDVANDASFSEAERIAIEYAHLMFSDRRAWTRPSTTDSDSTTAMRRSWSWDPGRR